VTVRDFLVRNVTLREFNVTVVISPSFFVEFGVMTLVLRSFPGGEGVAFLRRRTVTRQKAAEAAESLGTRKQA
jgi:hypothetical protein